VSQVVLGVVGWGLQDNPQIQKVRIECHTDSIGRSLANQKLSQRRADAVRLSLVARGIDPDRLEAVGFGATQPIASNTTARGRAENRRTEFRIEE
jgi:outer membrane protein OmpA-like peptidoglycan-associated protein